MENKIMNVKAPKSFYWKISQQIIEKEKNS